MRRRDALTYGLTLPALWHCPALRAQPAGAKRAAVVIGVDKAGDLPVLRAAAAGASKMAKWLTKEGFEVTPFVDSERPVRAHELFAAVKALVDRGTLDQLVIYFAGHGFINNYSEYWLLSDAPENPNEAVLLMESVYLANNCAIPNVVFISDACRSRSDSLSTSMIKGSVLFPVARSAPNTDTDVDQFLATKVGEPSWEVPVDQSKDAYQGIYTEAFLAAFRHPEPSMVRTVDGKAVVPNNRLEEFLRREVQARAERASIRLKQRPDTKVTSSESTYIGRAGQPRAGPPASDPPQATTHDVFSARLASAGLPALSAARPPVSRSAIERTALEIGADSARATFAIARGLPTQQIKRCGFAVTGRRLQAVVTGPQHRAEFRNANDERNATALVDVELRTAPAASVALRFDDGTGTVLAALDGFVCNLVVDKGGIISVSYVPSQSSPLFSLYRSEAARIDELHEVVATAARFGSFRIEGTKDSRNRAAEQMADRIRMLKGVDPTLGVYAAYAYADAGLKNKVRSVHSFMRGDLKVDLFDVAMLAGALAGRPADDPNGPVPFVPMLSQGWSLLRVTDTRLPEGLALARDQLRPSLWTWFGVQGMERVEAVLRTGRAR